MKKQYKKGIAQSHKNWRRSIEYENEKGTCDLQIKFRLFEYIKMYKDLPSESSKKGEGRAICKVLVRRFGNLQKAFKHHGLPIRHRMGTTVELLAPNGKQMFFNYNQGYSKDKVLDWMIENCEALKTFDGKYPEKIDYDHLSTSL